MLPNGSVVDPPPAVGTTWRERARALPEECAPPFLPARAPARPRTIAATVLIVAFALRLIPGRAEIPPLVESDYAYLLTAADRFVEGFGPTAPVPVAPHQPWVWHSDWTLLTKWPVGYPLLIGTVRLMAGLSTLQACAFISLFACASALVGWFTLIKRCLPPGSASTLCALLAAGSSVSTASLLDPSTDLLVTAALPFLLMLSIACLRRHSAMGTESRLTWRVALAGLAAGALFWVRYASVFVPLVIGCVFIIQWRRRRLSRRIVMTYIVAASVPIAALLILNRLFGPSESLQSQLNLGRTVRFGFTPELFLRAWSNFTDLGFYDHHAFTRWVFALWPVVLIGAGVTVPTARRALRSYLRSPGVLLGVVTVLVLLLLLTTVTALFGDKYPYASLARYYQPIKPFYYLLFVGPVLLVRVRALRVAASLVMLVGCSWIVGQEWQRPFAHRRLDAGEVSPYGRRAQAFTPHATALYEWLQARRGNDLIVVSNFHEFITLETKIPTLPIPPDRPTLDEWIQRICNARGVDHPRVLFVLDPDNRWRSYWIPPPDQIVRHFALARTALANPPLYVWQYTYGDAVSTMVPRNVSSASHSCE